MMSRKLDSSRDWSEELDLEEDHPPPRILKRGAMPVGSEGKARTANRRARHHGATCKQSIQSVHGLHNRRQRKYV